MLELLKPYIDDDNLDKKTVFYAIYDLFEGSGDAEAYEVAKSIIQDADYSKRRKLEDYVNKIKFRI
ncbi:MAG: hypothetical protein F7B60_03100 [Desulfurococcales archaeon]|nr:hypothetical protein [Desulfurococcales archaeon]